MWFLLVLILASYSILFAQTKYDAVDRVVQKLGSLPNVNVAIVADTISETFTDKEQKARAIFYWIANNIAIDAKAVKQNDAKNTLPEKVMELRKTTPLGFSLLFQEMCSHVKIRCLSVDGFVKNYAAEINDPADEINYSWNVVQLGQSPETWYYVDASKASGALDKKMNTFTRQFTSEYFFADRTIFNLAYFPDNAAWQLGNTGPKSKKDFYNLVVVNNEAFAVGLGKPLPIIGTIKTKINVEVIFSFNLFEYKIPKNISLIIGDEKKQPKPEPMNFTDNGGSIKFAYRFKKEDTFPIKVLADGREVLQYNVEVKE